MQFKVPQFLEIEDKIFGPFTFREFIYLIGGAGLCFVLYKWLGLTLGLIPMVMIAALSGSLTFYKPNGKPFVEMLESGLKFLMQDKLYIWKRRTYEKKESKDESADKKLIIDHTTSKLDGSKLRDLAWSLDVLDLKKPNQRNNY